MDFPADPPSSFQMQATHEQLAETLGLPRDKILNVEISPKLEYVVIELDPSVDIPSMKVESQALVTFSHKAIIDCRDNCSPKKSNSFKQ